MTHVLIATPYRVTTHRSLLDQAATLRREATELAVAAGYIISEAVVCDDAPITPDPEPYARHAGVRNALIADCLRPEHDAVLWVDADLVQYPATIIPRLDAVRRGGIAAPAVYLDKEAPGRWYDTGGFIEIENRHTPVWPPHFLQPGPVVNLLSVGCIYLAPAQIYRDGARYAPASPHVEHWPVMRFAAARGLPIVCDLRLAAYHAYLPDYGEGWHDGRQ